MLTLSALKLVSVKNYIVTLIVGEAKVEKYMFSCHAEGQFHFMFILYLQV